MRLQSNVPATHKRSSHASDTIGSPLPTCSSPPLADRHNLGILHYDHDYDVIAEKTDLRFDSVWVAAEAPCDGPQG